MNQEDIAELEKTTGRDHSNVAGMTVKKTAPYVFSLNHIGG